MLLYIRESYQQLRGLSLLKTGMSYTILRGHWYHIIVLNVHGPTDDKIDVKNSFFKEVEHVFNKLPKFCLAISMPTEDIFKLTNGNESLHEISYHNEVRLE
jgi:hypothetical protein